MATYRSRYVDPDTSGYVLTTEKRYQRIDAVLGWVYGMLTTERGSIAELPWFGSRLRTMTHVSPGVTRQMEAAVDEALGPFVGKKFDSYTRKAWIQNGAPLLSVTVKVAGASGAVSVPLTVE